MAEDLIKLPENLTALPCEFDELCFLCALVNSETTTQDCVAWLQTIRKILFINVSLTMLKNTFNLLFN